MFYALVSRALLFGLALFPLAAWHLPLDPNADLRSTSAVDEIQVLLSGEDAPGFSGDGRETLSSDLVTQTLSADPPVRQGLVLDLDADRGIIVNDSGLVERWDNQSTYSQARSFTPQDEGRAVPGSGRPSLKKNVAALNGHSTVVFREHELLNRDEDAFDHLITGSGYTFFCVVAPYQQDGKLQDVNSFFGNLRNGGLFEGIWGGFADDNRVWAAPRNGLSFGRWDDNNPFLVTDMGLEADRYYLVMGRMSAGTDSALVEIMVNEWMPARFSSRVKVNIQADASKMSIGQERDATQHPGVESFDGEIARFLLYERPLGEKEMKKMIRRLTKEYNIR